MKKTVAFLMVLTLILSLGASAFADTLFPDGQGVPPVQIPQGGQPAGDPFSGIPGLLILLMEDDTIYEFVPISQVTNVDYKDAAKFLDPKTKEAFAAFYKEAKTVEGRKLRKAYWFNIPDNYTLDDEHYAKYLFSCDGSHVEVTVNGDPVEVVSVNGRTSYIAKITARGPIAIYNGDGTPFPPKQKTEEVKPAEPTVIPSEVPTAIPAETPAEVPAAIPAEAPAEVPATIPADAPAEAPTETREELKVIPAVIPAEIPAETPAETQEELKVIPAVIPADISAEASAEPASSDDPFSGTWYISRIDVGGGTQVNAADMGIEMTVTFSDDGTAVMTGMGQELQGTWKRDGDSAVVTADGSEAVFTLTEEGLTGVQNGSEMLFTRTAPGPGFEPAEAVAAKSVAEFDGRWKAAMISMQGMTMAYEAANANGSLPILPADTIIISNGTVAYEGQEPEAFTFKDGALVEPGEYSWEPDTYRLLEDGTLVYEFMGYMNIYFERTE